MKSILETYPEAKLQYMFHNKYEMRLIHNKYESLWISRLYELDNCVHCYMKSILEIYPKAKLPHMLLLSLN